MTERTFIQTVQHNCDISDARDSGICSICNLVLKLRNLYKWEHDIEPWDEPESADLLDWIETKENFWDTIAHNSFQPLAINSREIEPWEQKTLNKQLAQTNLVYGAGYGRSMKAIFFLAEKIRQESIEGCPVLILGREKAKELASPFAMLQDGVIYIRREPLRFFFWDHNQDIRSSSSSPLHHALDQYGLLSEGKINQQKVRLNLDSLVDREMPLFIFHEVGEKRQTTLDSTTLKKIISLFPDSAIELVARSLKDILADTHPLGTINFIIREKREASLGFYVGFLDGLRKLLFPEIIDAFQQFLADHDWKLIEQARSRCREKIRRLAEKIEDISLLLDREPHEQLQKRFNEEILVPLGLDTPE